MSDWGDEAIPTEADTAAESKARFSAALAGVDVGESAGVDIADMVAQLVPAAIAQVVQKTVSQTVSKAVKEALTEEHFNTIQEQTEAAIEDALTAESDEEEEEEAELVFESVDEFVREYICDVYRRRIGGQGEGRVWQARWWESREAVIRLEALWRAWEFLRRDPTTGMSVWFRDHADHHMGVLFDPDGPFAGATSADDRCGYGEPLPYVSPPDGMFVSEREEE